MVDTRTIKLNLFKYIFDNKKNKSGQYPVWMTMKSRKGDLKEWKSKKFPGGAHLRTPLEAGIYPRSVPDSPSKPLTNRKKNTQLFLATALEFYGSAFIFDRNRNLFFWKSEFVYVNWNLFSRIGSKTNSDFQKQTPIFENNSNFQTPFRKRTPIVEDKLQFSKNKLQGGYTLT